MTVRDDWQEKGVGTALMQAAIDLAEKWLAITRVEQGTKIAVAFRDGQYVDTMVMARVRRPG